MSESNIVTIYIYLPDEAVDVWRPVEAENLGNNLFRIISNNEDTEDEKWEFNKGDIVICEKKKLSGSSGQAERMVAIKKHK
jgi:hypothetical protein